MPAKIWTDEILHVVKDRASAGKFSDIGAASSWAGERFFGGYAPGSRGMIKAWRKIFPKGPALGVLIATSSGQSTAAAPATGREVEVDLAAAKGKITTRSLDIKTVEQAIAVAEVDLNVWEITGSKIKSWEVTGRDVNGKFQTYTNWGVTVQIKRRSPEARSLELLLDEIKFNAPKPAKLRAPRKRKARRLLELSIVDVHNGLRCSGPVGDDSWDLDISRRALLDTSAALIHKAEMFGPFEQLVVPIGHDWMHIDTAEGTTTSGTNQPESEQWHKVFLAGERLALEWALALREVAPLRIVVVPGNHDYLSGFAMGRVLAAYFHNDPRVEVDASADIYKWIEWGVNLIGMTHKSKAPIRMAALMANERPNAWARTSWREWHLGDQHRTGNSNPAAMEEQGVGVEFLPSIVPGNEWHRRKALNHQRRAGTAHIWDRDEGPVCRMVQRAVLPKS